MSSTQKNLITRTEAAARAGVDRRTIDRWRSSGLLPTYTRRAGRTEPRVMIDADELDKLITPKLVPAQRGGS
jgi:predicted site-specific integrase-resolvase